MEFRRATLDERPDPWLVERHEREIFPLLHRRAWFAEAHDFLLYDLVTDGGGVDEHVLRLLERRRARSARSSSTTTGSRRRAGWIRDSAAYARKAADGAKRLVRRSLAEGLGLPERCRGVRARSATRGQAWSPCGRAASSGSGASTSRSSAYEYHVFWEFRELHDGSAGQWARLAARLGGRGVPSLEDALRELQLEPVHAPFRAIFARRRSCPPCSTG